MERLLCRDTLANNPKERTGRCGGKKGSSAEAVAALPCQGYQGPAGVEQFAYDTTYGYFPRCYFKSIS